MDSLNVRFKEIRKALNKTQTEFASIIGLSQSSITMIECGERVVSDRHVKAICALCNVNENWLRTGTGDMFLEDASSLLEKLADGLGMSSDEQELLETFMSFPDDERAQVISFVKQFAARIVKKPTPTVDPIQQELADYEAELRAQQQDASASAAGVEPIKNRA